MAKRTVLLGVLVLLFAFQLPAEELEISGLPLHKEKLSDRAIRLWIGDYQSTTAVVALATDKGVVVIDTTDLPGVDAELRNIIAEELGREDFKYLINTHEHADHTSGNAVYADCEIIAHQQATEGIKSRADDLPRIMSWYRENLPQIELEVREAATSEEEAAQAENLKVSKARLAGMEAGIGWQLPTITFSERMRLDMGDMTIELSYAGGLHSASDIFIFVPEEGLLFTGDTMADTWFTDSPGCLQAFMVRRGVQHDFPLLLDSWQRLLARKEKIKDLVPAHWNGDISLQGFEARYSYIKTLWEGIGEAVDNGRSLDQVLVSFNLGEHFPELVNSPGVTPRNHRDSLIAVWCELTGDESAADALAAAISTVGIDKAIAECKAARLDSTSHRYFLERELNQLGYRYLGEQKLDEAIAVFALNTELYPDSWNVYDSLGEAYLAKGDNQRSAKLYRRSLEIVERFGNERQPPDKVLDAIGVKKGMVIGEVGAGRGRYTVHLADRVGSTGKVYANDISPAAIEALRARCQRDRLTNIEPILGEEEDPLFPEAGLDMIFMVWVYHMVESPVPLLRSFGPSLKAGAPVVMVEPVPEEIREELQHATSMGASDFHVNVLTAESMEAYANQAGFKLTRTIDDLLEKDIIYLLKKE
jgi:glyoxylase-like metal-dependent hydrolase (beta-lactamase superfamily II)/ubiquinone/menaquinone biosynthesis C-methylase UbiE